MNITLRAGVLAINLLTPPRQLPNPFVPSLKQRVDGKLVVITGASSGIGRALAERVAAEGATVIVVARREDDLSELVRTIKRRGGDAHAIAADLSSEDGINHVADVVLGQFGAPDILISNAGRSIMRALAASEHRLHDYERTMRINYLAGVGLTLRFLPGMRERGSGHVIHTSSIAAVSNLPRFSAYLGSKIALDAFLRTAQVESLADGVKFTNVHIPLASTAMASGDWTSFASLSVDQAVGMMVDAIRRRPRTVDNPLGRLYTIGYAVAPGPMDYLQNMFHRSRPETDPAPAR